MEFLKGLEFTPGSVAAPLAFPTAPALTSLNGLGVEEFESLFDERTDPDFVLKSFQLSVFDVDVEETKLFLLVTVDLVKSLE